jgi:hypothetical protein
VNRPADVSVQGGVVGDHPRPAAIGLFYKESWTNPVSRDSSGHNDARGEGLSECLLSRGRQMYGRLTGGEALRGGAAVVQVYPHRRAFHWLEGKLVEYVCKGRE